MDYKRMYNIRSRIVYFIRALAYKVGIDKSIFYTSAAKIIQAFGGVISALFIAKFLSREEQGFYYTFGSILAIQVFFELGMNGIITQYVAHEISNLKWIGTRLEGNDKYKSRLSSLLHFSIKWYLCFAFALFVILLIVGALFFAKYGKNGDDIIQWKSAWLLLTVCTSINLVITPLFSFLEGLGKVKEVAIFRFYQKTLGLLVVWSSFYFGAKLMTLGINSLVWIIVSIFAFSLTSFGRILKDIWAFNIREKVLYKKEIFPYQWKIALSWVSGYFIFQLFNPILFATEGPIIAGQMGMTLAILNGIQALSLSWMTTKIPLFSGLIAQKQYSKLDLIFDKALKQSVFINALGLIVLFIAMFLIREYHITVATINFGDRFLDYLPMVLMMVPIFINQYVSSWATYLRCHKKEPFLVYSIVVGILCCLSTILLGNYCGVVGVTIGYCLITFSMSFWGYWIFKTKKQQWHND